MQIKKLGKVYKFYNLLFRIVLHNFSLDMKRLKFMILFRCSRCFATINSLWLLRKQAIIILGVTKLIHKQNWRFRSRELNTRPTQAFFLCVSKIPSGCGKDKLWYSNKNGGLFSKNHVEFGMKNVTTRKSWIWDTFMSSENYEKL